MCPCWIKVFISLKKVKSQQQTNNYRINFKEQLIVENVECSLFKQALEHSCTIHSLFARSPDLQLVGIWTVHRSSEDSSVDVPIKSKLRQLWASLSSCMSSPCWLSSFRFKFFPDACRHTEQSIESLINPKAGLVVVKKIYRQTVLFSLWSITLTCFRRLQERVKMSNKEESRNDDAIFLCFVSGCVDSAWRMKELSVIEPKHTAMKSKHWAKTTFIVSHLANAFIQSNLQMRTIEAIKTNKRAILCKSRHWEQRYLLG